MSSDFFNIQESAPLLTLDPQGIWVAKANEVISYPEDGNQTCFELEDKSYWFRHRNNLICELYRKFDALDSIFDIGGGNGIVSKYLIDNGASCVLVEPGRIGAINAKQRGVEHVIQATLKDAGFVTESIDHVGLFDVVEHIKDDLGFLQKIHEYQKNDKFLVLTVPSLNWLWSKEDVHAGHYRRYTKRALEELLKNAGYEICYCSYFFSFLTLPVFMVRTVPSVLGLRNRPSLKVAAREHTDTNPLVKKLLEKFMTYESNQIRVLKKIGFGSSLIAIVRKHRTT